MKIRAILIAAILSGAWSCGIRTNPVEPAAIAPANVMDFNVLYAKNCSGCHGADGKDGAAISLGNPVYLAIAADATIASVTSDGVAGTSMPAFAKRSGGMLTDEQIQAIVRGIRVRWAKPDAVRGEQPPPYTAQSPGDPKHGALAFGVYCAGCHGAEGRGGRASSIVDSSYLALVSDQSLRTTMIAGRPDMGSPDWRADVPGRPMSPDDVSDVVAWLAVQRTQGGNQ
jgi:mono/diheme cytochrome c family protein